MKEKGTAREAVSAFEANGRKQVELLLSTIVQTATTNGLAPGWVMLGVCEFLAIMVHQNIPPPQHEEEIERFATYIRDRLKEFTDD